jgi:hypothetical protein
VSCNSSALLCSYISHTKATFLGLQIVAKRFLACARCKLWWMTPEVGNRAKTVPPETQFLLLELEEGKAYALILPLICKDFRGTLRPSS